MYLQRLLKKGLQHLESDLYHVVFLDIPINGYDENQVLDILEENKSLEKSSILLLSSLDLNEEKLEKWKQSDCIPISKNQ